VLDAVIARDPEAAERAALVLIDGAYEDMQEVLASRRALPSLVAQASPLKAPRKQPASPHSPLPTPTPP
jgi:ribosome biogenesis protein Tsr3